MKAFKRIYSWVSIYFPIRGNAVAMALGYFVLRYAVLKLSAANHSFFPLVEVMYKVANILLVLLIIWCLLTVVVAYWHAKLNYGFEKNRFNYIIQHSTANKGTNLQYQLNGVLVPWLGTLYGALVHSKAGQYSIMPLSAAGKQRGFFVKKIDTTQPILLADYRAYDVQKAFVLFRDVLNLFQLPLRLQQQSSFVNTAIATPIAQPAIEPPVAIEMQQRIKQLRRVDGEMLHYKPFANGDDTRRIVWKIFAKNRELVVRTPEIFNPFTSHAVVLTSFHQGILLPATEDVMQQLLNHHKQAITNVLYTLQQQEMHVQWLADQSVASQLVQAEQVALCNWQREQVLPSALGKKKLAILMLHSLNSENDLEEMLPHITKQTLVYVSICSASFTGSLLWSWAKKIFWQSAANIQNTTRRQWILSGSKTLVKRNEEKLRNWLTQNNITFTQL